MTDAFGLVPFERAYAETEWLGTRRDDQAPPADADWATWVVLGGRGSGKTRTGAEWILDQVRKGARRIALVAPTLQDAREVMLGGSSGLLKIAHRNERPHYEPTRRRLLFPNGAVAHVFSAHEPDRLRGPQFDCGWGDEFCAWPDPEAVMSNLRLGLRLGAKPRLCLTSTPRPLPLLDRVLSEPGTRLTRSRTRDNQAHLSPGFVAAMEDLYGGSALGRQELDGVIIRDHPGAIFSRAHIDRARVVQAPELDRIIVTIDPSVTSGQSADACGLLVMGQAKQGDVSRAYLLHDATLNRAAPEDWAKRAVELYHAYEADCIVAETNQGGDMVKSLIHQTDADVPVIKRFARKSKSVRAMPVGLLYARGRVCHVGRFDALEDELCAFGGPHQSGSPDRMDALVWGATELLLERRNPRISFL